MKQQTILRFTFAASMLVATTTTATAHGDHDHDDAPKLKPETCEQFADRTRYSNDLSDPDIKKLKETCDAKKKLDTSSATDTTKKKDDQG